MKMNLCMGKKQKGKPFYDKNNKGKCIHSKIDVRLIKIPIYARSEVMKTSLSIIIWCNAKTDKEGLPKIISKYITSCENYNNRRLF